MTALDVVLTAVGVLAVLVASISAKMRSLPFSEPMIAFATGLVASQVLTALPEPVVTTLPFLPQSSGVWETGTRLLLAVSVMGVALRYKVHQAREHWAPVALLLLVVMPLMAVTSAALAWGLGLGLGTAAVVGAAVAPTDPVLASSVVTGGPAERDLPLRDRVLLSLESGANDGLALPLVLLATVVAGRVGGQGPTDLGAAVAASAYEVLVAVAVGALCGWGAGLALRAGQEHGAVETGPKLVFVLVLALGVLGLNGVIGADGVLGVFSAGLALAATAPRGDTLDEDAVDDGVNRFVVLPLFLLLGVVLPSLDWAAHGWTAAGIAVAVLVLRRLPWVLLLRRPLRLAMPDALFVGWFGPIGVSALFYAMLASERGVGEEHITYVVAVVAASTLVHGISSSPLRRWYVHVTRQSDRARAG